MKKFYYQLTILLVSIFLCNSLQASIVNVNPGDNLDSIVESASGGDTILVAPGTYDPLFLQGLTFTKTAPLIVKSAVDKGATIYREGINSDAAILLKYCSYIKFEGFVLEGGCWSVYVWGGDHIILNNNEMKNTGQEGIHVGFSAKYVDVIGNHVHNTGLYIPKYGEGIYVGNGSRDRFPDTCEYVWIENNIVHDCANGEGVNVKPECFHITVKGNEVYNISPGTSDQSNIAAISVEGAVYSNDSSFRLDESRDVWITNNTVHNVTTGYEVEDWGSGIMACPIGVYVVGNTIYDCEDKGFHGNNWEAIDSMPIYFYNNTIYNCGQIVYWPSEAYVIEDDPGENPNVKQSWSTSIIAATSINLSDTSIVLEEGNTYQLSATILPTNATYQGVIWSSNDTSVASVNSTGLVTANSIGNTVITVTNSNNEVTATCSIEVEELTIVAATSITLSDTNLVLEIGDTCQLSATILPTNATYQGLVWSSNDTTVASINSTGLVTAISAGNALITVANSNNEVTASCSIEVEELAIVAATSITLNDTSIVLEEGNTYQLSATILPANATYQGLVWGSSNTTVASVSSAGLVTANNVGYTTISVTNTNNEVTATCAVEVDSAMVGELVEIIVQIDLGRDSSVYLSTGGWNNLSNPLSGSIVDLIDENEVSTGISISVTDSFNNGINTGGLKAAYALDIPHSASRDCFFGSTGSGYGGSEATGGFTISNLDTSTAYSFLILGSQSSTLNLETEYIVSGATTVSETLNVANNNTELIEVFNMMPSDNGTITITATKGANNTDPIGYYYINVIKFSYQTYAVNETSAEISLSSSEMDVDSEDVKIYPNPLQDKLYVDGATGRVLIYNMGGQLIQQSKIESEGYGIDVSSLSSGFYVVRIHTDDSMIIVRKFNKN